MLYPKLFAWLYPQLFAGQYPELLAGLYPQLFDVTVCLTVRSALLSKLVGSRGFSPRVSRRTGVSFLLQSVMLLTAQEATQQTTQELCTGFCWLLKMVGSHGFEPRIS